MKQKNIKQAIREHFFLHPTEKLRVRQLDRSIGGSLPSTIRSVKELEKEGFLGHLEVVGVTFYVANRSSRTFLVGKRLFNIWQLYDSGLVDYLAKQFSEPALSVFGSYAKGEDTEASDIDIYVEAPSKKDVALEAFEKKLQRPIQLFVHKSIREVRNKELANSILNGVVLHGYLEVFS